MCDLDGDDASDSVDGERDSRLMNSRLPQPKVNDERTMTTMPTTTTTSISMTMMMMEEEENIDGDRGSSGRKEV